MSGNNTNITHDEYGDFDERLRELENGSASIVATINSMSTDITEMKDMFKTFIQEAHKITETREKISSLDQRVTQSFAKYDNMYDRFIKLEHGHELCNSNKVAEQASAKELEKKINDTLMKVSNIEASLKSLQDTKAGFTQKIVDMGAEAIKYLFYFIIIYVFYMIIIHSNKDDVQKSLLKPELPKVEQKANPGGP